MGTGVPRGVGSRWREGGAQTCDGAFWPSRGGLGHGVVDGAEDHSMALSIATVEPLSAAIAHASIGATTVLFWRRIRLGGFCEK